MKLGILADIHGNLQALEAVLAFLEPRADLIVCAGDLVAYGADPEGVIVRLRNAGVPSVTGNYDDAVAWDRASASRTPSSARNEPLKRAALTWAKDNVTQESRRYLRGLPWHLGYRLAGRRVVVLHAGLAQLDAWLVPETPDLLEDAAARLDADVLVLAHTHRAFSLELGGRLIVNPGAVGRALDGDTRACCALLDLSTLTLTHHRLAYDHRGAVEAIRRSTMPPEIALLVEHGARRIEEVLEEDSRYADA